MTTFDTDTAVERVGADLYSAHIDPKWWVIRGPNGGYVLVRTADGATALRTEVGDAAPRRR